MLDAILAPAIGRHFHKTFPKHFIKVTLNIHDFELVQADVCGAAGGGV